MARRDGSSAVALAVLGLGLLGCDPAAAEPGTAVRRLSEGVGEPLVTRIDLAPGDLRDWDTRLERTRGVLTIDGRPLTAVYRLDVEEPISDDVEPGLSDRGDLIYYEHKADGLWFWGSERSRLLALPLLQVALPLRVGSEWVSFFDGDGLPAFHFQCEGEQDVEVPAGRFRVAVVRQTDLRQRREALLWFAEGVGRVRSLTLEANESQAPTSDQQLRRYVTRSEEPTP